MEPLEFARVVLQASDRYTAVVQVVDDTGFAAIVADKCHRPEDPFGAEPLGEAAFDPVAIHQGNDAGARAGAGCDQFARRAERGRFE